MKKAKVFIFLFVIICLFSTGYYNASAIVCIATGLLYLANEDRKAHKNRIKQYDKFTGK